MVAKVEEKKKRVQPERNIMTEYFSLDNSQVPVHVNYANSARRARVHATDHLQEDHYKNAWIAVISHKETGELFSILKWTVDGEIRILFMGDKKRPMCLTNIKEELT